MKHLAFTIAFALLNHLSLAYNADNQLVSTYDTLTVFDELNTEVGEWKL